MDTAQEPRNKCECLIRKQVQKLNDSAATQDEKDIAVILQQMHVRLTLLEGVTPRQLSHMPCKERSS